MNIWIKKISFIFFLSVFVVSCNQNKQQNEPKNNNSENKKDSAFSNNLEKPNFNIFIENSVSMDGYLAPDTSGFKKIVYGLITRLKSKDIASKINLSYINDTICNFRPKHLDNDIFYLMESLNPNSLRDYACNGNRTTSFLPDILQKVISLVDSNEVNILVSDFIFSTNKGNSTKYLDEQHDKVEFSISKQFVRYCSSRSAG